MNVTVRYFAAARELVGTTEERVEIFVSATTSTCTQSELRDALVARHTRLSPYMSRMRLAVNGDFAERETVVANGDEVDVLPPVAGGDPVALVDVRATPLSVDECLRAVMHASAGGICVFVGVVRDHADGHAVSRLDYEAHVDLAIKETKRVLASVAAEHDGVRVAAMHRVGELTVGDFAVVVTASAPHRDAAFAACRAAIDRIKETVPIWKKEWSPDGTALWVNFSGE